jgi:hypothetical protein
MAANPMLRATGRRSAGEISRHGDVDPLDGSDSISAFWGLLLSGKFAAYDVLAPVVRASRFSDLKT